MENPRNLVLLAIVLCVACGDGPATPDGGPIDSAADEGLPDSASDTSVPVECTFPDIIVAGTAETDVVADSPARCGLAPYVWSRDPSLGEVIEYGSAGVFRTPLLTSLAEMGFMEPLATPLEHDVSWVQFRYTTQNKGALTEATAVAAFPNDLGPGAELDILLFAPGGEGTNDACAFSRRSGALAVSLLASYGYLVVSPDYIGRTGFGESSTDSHPALIGEPTAHASLDAVRAAARIPPELRQNTCARPRLLVYGPSQGGHAALWIERLAPYYARELELLGTVAITPPGDLSGQAVRALSSFDSVTLIYAAAFTVQSQWYGLDDRLDEVFVAPWDADLPGLLEANCFGDEPLQLEFSDPRELFQSGLVDEVVAGRFEDVEPWSCLMEENSPLNTSIPRLGDAFLPGYGILYTLGDADTLVDPAIERLTFDELCAQGFPLQYLECAGADHVDAFTRTIDESIAFLADRAAGVPIDPSAACVRAAAVACSEASP